MKKHLYWLLSIVLFISGCSDSNSGGSDEPHCTYPIQTLTRDQQVMTDSANHFAFKFLKTLNTTTEDPNYFVSPVSASLLLSMITNGAVGETKDEIKSVIGLSPYTQGDVNAFCRALVSNLLTTDKDVTVNIANSVWINKTYEIKQQFKDSVKNNYEAGLNVCDFSQNDLTAKTINNWCSDHTNGHIKNMFSTSEIDGGVAMILVNALYFKAKWANSFDSDLTANDNFTNEDGSVSSVKMMNKQLTASYVKSNDFTVVELPYGEGGYSMVIALPNSQLSQSDAANRISSDIWKQWMGTLGTQTINLQMPKFQMDYSCNMNSILYLLGMKNALTQFADYSDIGKDVHINLIKQKTYLNIDEDGTEAAAITSGSSVTSPGPVSNVINMKINHPFFFFIKEKRTGAILFEGRINKL
jgi:serine protease inhibitor